MPQPPEVVDAADELLDLYRQAQRRLEARMAQILADPKAQRERRRIRAILKQVKTEIEALEAATRTWVTESLPSLYEAGGASVGLSVDWANQIHATAMQALAESTFEDVLSATSAMDADSKRWVRETSRWMSSESYIEGLNPTQVARQFAEKARSAVAASGLPAPIGSVTYANGATHSIDTYAEMLFRTKTAQTFNAGTINSGLAAGAEVFEIVDGLDCGLRDHDDGDKANGRIVEASVAAAYPISHPNCRRSFIPRYDIGAESADQFSIDIETPSEIIAAEYDLPEQPYQRARRKKREARQSRQRYGRDVTPDNFEDTVAAYTLPDGSWTPERQQLHDEIVASFLEDIPESAAPTLYMTGGGPASGKSTMIDANPELFPDADVSVHIDPDAVKLKLPEYQALTEAGDLRAARFAHEESSYLSKRVLTEAYGQKLDLLYDSVGDSSLEKLAGKLDEAHAAGHRVIANYATLDTDLAVQLSTARALKTGREVPESYIRGAHAKVTDTFIDAIDAGLYDEAYLWDTNLKDAPRKVLEFIDGRVTILDEDLWQDFIAKGSRSAGEVTDLLAVRLNGTTLADGASLADLQKASYGSDQMKARPFEWGNRPRSRTVFGQEVDWDTKSILGPRAFREMTDEDAALLVQRLESSGRARALGEVPWEEAVENARKGLAVLPGDYELIGVGAKATWADELLANQLSDRDFDIMLKRRGASRIAEEMTEEERGQMLLGLLRDTSTSQGTFQGASAMNAFEGGFVSVADSNYLYMRDHLDEYIDVQTGRLLPGVAVQREANGVVITLANEADLEVIRSRGRAARNYLDKLDVYPTAGEDGFEHVLAEAFEESWKPGVSQQGSWRSPVWTSATDDEAQRIVDEWGSAHMIRVWSATSNDKHPVALAFQEEAQDLFGLDGAAGWRFNEYAEDVTGDLRAGMRGFLNAEYAVTQEVFESAGITHVPLYRGTSGFAYDLPAGVDPGLFDVPGGEQIDAVLRPMSSFSTDHAAAERFARSSGGVVIQGEVPVERILGMPGTGVGCYIGPKGSTEHEMVILNGSPLERWALG